MKKIMILALVMIGLQVNAQEKRHQDHREARKDRMAMLQELPAEDIAELQSKKMTLHLDLSESQQTKVKALILEETKVRKMRASEMKAKKEAGTLEKPSKEERVQMMNDRLDRQIEMKKQMKAILNDEQYQKWESSLRKRSDRKQRRGHSSKAKR